MLFPETEYWLLFLVCERRMETAAYVHCFSVDSQVTMIKTHTVLVQYSSSNKNKTSLFRKCSVLKCVIKPPKRQPTSWKVVR